MGGWKDKLRLSDMDDKQPIELQCKSCRQVTMLDRDKAIKKLVAQGIKQQYAKQYYVSQFEERCHCLVFGCNGMMRLHFTHSHRVSAWIGGMP